MSKLLFSDIPSEDAAIVKSLKLTKTLSFVMCGVAVAFGILGYAVEGFKGEDAVLFAIFPLTLVLLFAGLYLSAEGTKRQYLLVYEDAIKYKKPFSKNERVIWLAPSAYKIKVKKYYNRSCYVIYLIFLDENNHRILRYAPSCPANAIQRLKRRLNIIGCKIIWMD